MCTGCTSLVCAPSPNCQFMAAFAGSVRLMQVTVRGAEPITGETVNSATGAGGASGGGGGGGGSVDVGELLHPSSDIVENSNTDMVFFILFFSIYLLLSVTSTSIISQFCILSIVPIIGPSSRLPQR